MAEKYTLHMVEDSRERRTKKLIQAPRDEKGKRIKLHKFAARADDDRKLFRGKHMVKCPKCSTKVGPQGYLRHLKACKGVYKDIKRQKCEKCGLFFSTGYTQHVGK